MAIVILFLGIVVFFPLILGLLALVGTGGPGWPGGSPIRTYDTKGIERGEGSGPIMPDRG